MTATFRYYFRLQWTMLKRHLAEWGMHPAVGLLLALLAFYGGSYYLFTKTEYAVYAYGLAALATTYRYNDADRNDFLKLTFSLREYYRIRVTENLLTIIPFLIFLAGKKEWLVLSVLVPSAVLLVWAGARRKTVRTIPTPFYRHPFEFIVGFRSWLAGLGFAYFLTVMAVLYHNFNLGICALALIFLICLAFYGEPEQEFFVWIHRLSAAQFLSFKMGMALLHSTLLTLPVAVALIVFFPGQWIPVTGVMAMGYCYLLTMVLARYSRYPHSLNIPQAILLILGFVLPLLLPVWIPYFYIQSKRRLSTLLT